MAEAATRKADPMDIDSQTEVADTPMGDIGTTTPDAETPKKTHKKNSGVDEKSLYESRIKRYRYLLGQTELFAHFLDLKGEKDAALQKVLEEKRQEAKAEEGSRRRRKTEKEEDEEILKDESGESDEPLTVFTESPSYVTGGTLRDYQVQGLNWMVSLYENGINGILADEMGLGKTLQTISFLGYLKHIRGINGPHLVVVPKSTLHNWKNEFNKWTPDFNAFVFHGDKDTRNALIRDRLKPMDFEVCITSYEITLLEKAQFKKISWQYIIIDEAHRIKNENSMLSQIMRILESKNRMLITGTPLQNNLHELWALLNFLLPDVFNSSEAFDDWFAGQDGDQKKVIEQLHKVLRPFLLRRLKSDVEKSLLPKKEVNVYVKMSPMQRKWYQKILEKDIDAVNGGSGMSKREGKTRLLNIVMQLRKCCNHPYLFDGAEPGPPYTTEQHIVDNAGKMVVLDKLLTRLKAKGSRVLLFSQMSRVLDILEDYCWWRGFEYCRIDGQTNQEDRIDAIDEYNRPGSDKFIFLLTTRAGGLGINLTTADIVVLFDSDWNPQVDLQAMDRAHRIGQTKQVYVYRLVTENAIEEKVLERAAQKLRLDQLVIQQGRSQQPQKAPSKDELLNMIQHGAEKIFNEGEVTDSLTGDDDIDEILRRGEEKTAKLSKKYENLNIDELRNFTSESAYQWNGEDWSNKRKAGGVGLSWLGPAKRERKGNYAVDDYYKEVLRISTKAPSTKAPRTKRYACEDFQFFPPRLQELNEKDTLYIRKSVGYKVPPVSEEGDADEIKQQEKERTEEQRRIDEAEPLTEQEEEERKSLYESGFSNWSKKDFMSFINACARYGRDNLQAIADEIEGKTLDEIKEYSEVFWDRYTEIADYERQIAKIERGENELEKMADIQEQLSEKVSRHRVPLQQLKIQYTQPTKGKNYTEEEDRFLLVMLEKYGYGTENVYDHIRREIKESPMFRFDWFLKSRTSQEIARRCNTLIGLVQKENAELEERSQEEKKKKGGSKASTPTPKSRRR